MSDNPPTLHNHILQALEEQEQLREHSTDNKKRFGTLAAGLFLTHKKRKLTEQALPIPDKKLEILTTEDGADDKAAACIDLDDLDYFQRLKDECLKQEAEQSLWAKDLQAKVHDLRNVYIYGLSKV